MTVSVQSQLLQAWQHGGVLPEKEDPHGLRLAQREQYATLDNAIELIGDGADARVSPSDATEGCERLSVLGTDVSPPGSAADNATGSASAADGWPDAARDASGARESPQSNAPPSVAAAKMNGSPCKRTLASSRSTTKLEDAPTAASGIGAPNAGETVADRPCTYCLVRVDASGHIARVATQLEADRVQELMQGIHRGKTASSSAASGMKRGPTAVSAPAGSSGASAASSGGAAAQAGRAKQAARYHGKKASHSRSAGGSRASSARGGTARQVSQYKPGGPCDHCGVTESPQWRRGPASKPQLCNACGTRYRRTHQLSPVRAAAMAAADGGAKRGASAAAGGPKPKKSKGSCLDLNASHKAQAAVAMVQC